MAKVLVAGATGLLGSTLAPFLQKRGHQVICTGHRYAADINLDLTCLEQTLGVLEDVTPDVIINLSALTDVDRCERHPNQAYLLNVKTIENLCSWIRSAGRACHLIQISTDQLYDGMGPHSEEKVTISNHYAMSKLAGEFAARTVNSTILRTNFVGRSNRNGRLSLTDWLYASLCASQTISVFDDILFSPLSISTLCHSIEQCVSRMPHGIFNLGSRDGMSKADFAFAFANALGLATTNLVRTRSSTLGPVYASRPSDMRMQYKKYEDLMELQQPRLIDEIGLLVNDYL